MRQGDPLSPLLFVLAADFLQSILNKAMLQGLLSPPLIFPACPDFPVNQYAHDTLIVLKADANLLTCLKAILQAFEFSTGLKVNYHKYNMFPLNMDSGRLNQFSRTLNCQSGSSPLPIWVFLLELESLPWNIFSL
jgi:hypothetical protein